MLHAFKIVGAVGHVHRRLSTTQFNVAPPRPP
jgi:hypothetical protein